MIDWEAARVVLDVIFFAITGGFWIYVIFSARRKATRDQIQALSEKMTTRCEKVEARVTKMEAGVKTLPTTDAVHGLAMAITRLNGDVGKLAERLKGLRGIVERLETITERQEEFLLSRGSGK